jgi:hypothetical protein
MMYALWFGVYWGTMVSGSVLMTPYKLYWASGRFSIRSKVVFVLKNLLIKIILGLVVLAAVGFALIKFYGETILGTVQPTALILSNVYGMAVLVSLLAHGLFKLPIFVW